MVDNYIINKRVSEHFKSNLHMINAYPLKHPT